MHRKVNFDDIRPYYDHEILSAMKRIAKSEHLPAIADFVFPNRKIKDVQKLLRSFTSINDFQLGVMYAFNKQVIKKTTNSFTCSGFEHLNHKKNYLFVSNHRDIVLDSSLLQFSLFCEGFRSTEITFGSNLMISQLAVDIGRSNKMFKVIREGSAREFYTNSLRLSEYIRHTLTQKNESVWIAQRNGRTKDGNDITDQGIIRMFCMSNQQDLIKSIEELNIVPVSVSYQWEPCDIFKVKELYQSKDGEKYIKEKNEDLISILTGITQQKGNVHIEICKPLQKNEYINFVNESPNKFYKNIAQLIDNKIHQKYKLWNTNYIADDIRTGNNNHIDNYTAEEKELFLQRFNQILNQIDGDKDTISSIYLGIYANPVGYKRK